MSTYIDTINNLLPKETCHKCGKKCWKFTTEKCTWSCVCCGNLISFTFGVLEQQINRVMSSSARSSEFVYSEDGNYIKPKKDEQLKRLRFDGLLP